MKRSYAIEFRRKFGMITEPENQNRKVAEIGKSQIEQRKLLYIITKKYFCQKPNYESLFDSLQNQRTFCIDNSINQLACPHLSLDGLKWDIVQNMLRFIFHNSPVCMTVYIQDKMTEDEKRQIIKEHHENSLDGNHEVFRKECWSTANVRF